MQHKPPLAPVNKMGIGISGTHFPFDGAVHMNLKFKRPDDTSYILEYEPVLVSKFQFLMTDLTQGRPTEYLDGTAQ